MTQSLAQSASISADRTAPTGPSALHRAPQNRPQLLVTGAPLFLKRHRQLFDALAEHFPRLDRLAEPSLTFARRAVYKIRSTLYQRGAQRLLAAIERFVALTVWDARVFKARSLYMESQIVDLPSAPDLVIHVFGMSCPFWRRQTVPYVMILDYTASLARRHYPRWTPFVTAKAWRSWFDCERRAYSDAVHLFPFGNQTRRSLIEDYGIDPAKITVIGSSGHFSEPYAGDRAFGSKRILFYSEGGQEFYRKGGDRVLAAFRIVREQVPEARLAIVGTAAPVDEPGVENHGYVASRDKMRELFLTSDLVVAPARCDPFPGFLIEAMNFGVPCITSGVDGIPEIVDHGITGVVLSEPSPVGLAGEIMELLRDPQRLAAMSERGRQKVRHKLNWTSIAQAMAEAIQKHPILTRAEDQSSTTAFMTERDRRQSSTDAHRGSPVTGLPPRR
jgi:glycogen(starch) synthase